MTKKDFEMLADVLRRQRRAGTFQADRDAVDRISRALAVEVMNTNPRFDMPRFLAACECGFVYS